MTGRVRGMMGRPCPYKARKDRAIELIRSGGYNDITEALVILADLQGEVAKETVRREAQAYLRQGAHDGTQG